MKMWLGMIFIKYLIFGLVVRAYQPTANLKSTSNSIPHAARVSQRPPPLQTKSLILQRTLSQKIFGSKLDDQSTKRGTLFALNRVGKLVSNTKIANAANSNVWDMYGRVPYDDWLFTTSCLADPNLLKRSFVEVIQQEIPIVLPAFSRKKAIYTTLVMVRGVAGIVGGLAVLGCLLAWTRERMRRDRVLEEELRGFSTPVSAAYKGATNRGRPVEGMEGWVDLSRGKPGTSCTEDDDEEGSGSDGRGKQADGSSNGKGQGGTRGHKKPDRRGAGEEKKEAEEYDDLYDE